MLNLSLSFCPFLLRLRVVDSNTASRSGEQKQRYNKLFTVPETPYNSSLKVLASGTELFWKQALARYECISVPVRKTSALRFYPSMDLKANRQGLYSKTLCFSKSPVLSLKFRHFFGKRHTTPSSWASVAPPKVPQLLGKACFTFQKHCDFILGSDSGRREMPILPRVRERHCTPAAPLPCREKPPA